MIIYLSTYMSFYGKLRLRGCKGKSSIAAEIFLSKVFELSAYKCSHFQVAYLAILQYYYTAAILAFWPMQGVCVAAAAAFILQCGWL